MINHEHVVLGHILNNPVLFFEHGDKLSANLFTENSSRAVWCALEHLMNNKSEFDPFLLLEEAQRQGNHLELPFITNLFQSSWGSASLSVYIAKLNDRVIERELLAAAESIHQITHQNAPIADRLSQAQGVVMSIQESESKGLSTAGQVLKRIVDDYDNDAPIGLSTGFSNLDRVIDCLRPSDLTILAARPGNGKTTLAMNIALNVATAGKSALVFSLEMGEDQLMRRAIAAAGTLEHSRLINKTLEGDDWPKLSSAVQKLKDAKLLIDDTGALQINKIRAIARRAKLQHGVDLVVIDYIQLVRGDGQNRDREVAGISGSLKALAKELQVPVLCLSQLNREVDKRAKHKPRLSDLRDSGAIEQDADVIWFLHTEEHWEGVTELSVAKNRHGAVDSVYLSQQLQFSRFGEWHGEIPSAQVVKTSKFY